MPSNLKVTAEIIVSYIEKLLAVYKLTRVVFLERIMHNYVTNSNMHVNTINHFHNILKTNE